MNAHTIVVARDTREESDDFHRWIGEEYRQSQCAVLASTPAHEERRARWGHEPNDGRRLLGRGEAQRELGPATRRWLDPQIPVHRPREITTDGEAQARPLLPARERAP